MLAEESRIIIVSFAAIGGICGLEIANDARITVKSCKINKSEKIKLSGNFLFTYLRLRFQIKVLETGFDTYLDLSK